MTKFLLTIPEVCEALNLGKTKIYQLLASGEISALRVGRAVRVEPDEVERFVQRARQEQVPAAR